MLPPSLWCVTGVGVRARRLRVVAGVVGGLALGFPLGCGGDAANAGGPKAAGFALEGDFVPIGKPAASVVPLADELAGAGAVAPGNVASGGVASGGVASGGVASGAVGAGDDFYLAIQKSALAERWFLRAYMKQFYPGNASELGDREFGVRVVSFELQNDRLLVFDASDLFEASSIGNPRLLIEAYPVVRSPEFDALPGSSEYVLVDPATGLNEFSVSGHLYNDPYTEDLLGSVPLRIGLSFLQNFRQLDDGAAFEQVFNGNLSNDTTVVDVWGTLGISLRRYAEGPGFVPMESPPEPYFIASLPRLVPDSGGQTQTSPVRWNIHAGMQPITVQVSAGAHRAQAALPGADIIGALTRGIESWNDVFGFPVFEAVFVDSDAVPDDDATFVLVDYPGQGLRFARGDYRQNPNTGEILGASVYFGGNWFNFARFEDDPEAEGDLSVVPTAPLQATLGWGGLLSQSSVCTLLAPEAVAPSAAVADALSRTALEKGALWVEHVVAHEMGHVLGLRHNFKGSLVPPSTTLMDYLTPDDSVALPGPGAYDYAAIRYLYGLSPELPTQPFCTDEHAATDPNCVPDDSGAAPLYDYWAERYTRQLDLNMVSALPVSDLDPAGLNRVLGYARDPEDGLARRADRVAALRLALGRSAVPLEVADSIFSAAAANEIAEHVLRRVVLDPVETRGSIQADVTDPGVLTYLIDQLARILRNEDAVRSPALRRVAVDALRRLQSEAALVALRDAHTTVEAELAATVEGEPVDPLLADLAARIEAALSPYFD